MSRLTSVVAAGALLGAGATLASAQGRGLPADSVLVRSLEFRSIGPALMGGRIADIAVAENPPSVRGGRLGTVIYIGAATGGVWKSTNAGVSWTSVFDSVGTGGVGAVAVAPSNSDVVWVGTGEPNNMRSSSWGTGVYKSTDGGETWSAAMLPKSQHIGRIVIDPRDPDVVYVAALGPLWAPGGERGLYKTTDGGKTWTNTKEISQYTGFTDVAMDPSDPDVLYAAALERERREYSFLPAGPESGIYKTTNGGRSWTKLTQGLPKGQIGRIGLSVCRSRPSTVYAVIHAAGATGGVYRSDDAGETWQGSLNPSNSTAWYYGQIRCDPTDPDHAIRLLASSQQTWDGGKTWVPFATGGVHSDHHALWINPEAPEQVILGGDGGLYLSWDRGETWDHVESIPLAQFYAIGVDDAQPFYNVSGGLQDNQSWGGPAQTRNSFGPTNADWYRMSGGDGFYAVPDRWDDNLYYAESQNGSIGRYDARTGQTKNIRPVPKPGQRFRYNWSAPILPSRHTRGTVYFAANYLFRSTDHGDSWETISPDLTRAIDRNVLPMRGTIPDSTALGRHEGTADFGNITTIDESPLRAGLLVVGTDDGLVHVTRDGGRTWSHTDRFPAVPETTYVSTVAFSAVNEGTIYVSLDGHRSNDFTPYVMKSSDYGRTWSSITGDLPAGGSVQVVREDPRQASLLFAGSEFGIFATVDGGAHWLPLRSGIPPVPVHDIAIQERAHDLVVGTHGRGIFILDDITPLEQLARARSATVAYLFPVRDAMLLAPNGSRSSGMGTSGFAGQNPPPGPSLTYLVKGAPAGARVSLAILDGSGTAIRELAADRRPGLHRTTWDMRAGAPLTGPVDTAALAASLRASETGGRGGRAGRGGRGGRGGGGRFGGRGGDGEITFTVMPGQYRARLTIAGGTGAPTVLEQSFALRKDPMVVLADAELRQLNAFRLTAARATRDLRETQARMDSAERDVAALKSAADSAGERLPQATRDAVDALDSEMREIVAQVGAGFSGRGGRGGRGGFGGGRGAPPAGRGAAPPAGRGGARGGGGGGGGGDDDQNASADETPVQSIQQRLGTTNELMNSSFNPNPEQRKTMQTLPADLKMQTDRLDKLMRQMLPAVRKSLSDAGVEVKPGR